MALIDQWPVQETWSGPEGLISTSEWIVGKTENTSRTEWPLESTGCPSVPVYLYYSVSLSAYFSTLKIETVLSSGPKTVSYPTRKHSLRCQVRKSNPDPLLFDTYVSFLEPLHSNGCCVAAYFAVVAYRRIYIPQYSTSTVRPNGPLDDT
jgi:hypothetical protein